MPDEIPNSGEGAPNGTPTPTPTPAPAAGAQAQADAPVTMSAIKELLGSLKTEIVTEAKNGINADLRRAGVFKKQEPVEYPTPTPTTQQAPGPSAAAGMSVADVEALLERERVIATRSTKYALSDAQTRRMKSALTGVAPDQLATEADAFLNDLGLAKQSTPTVQSLQAPVVQPGAPQPISDKGSPAPGQFVANWKLELSQNPVGMSAAARSSMDAELGVDKARRMRLDASQRQAESIKVTRPTQG